MLTISQVQELKSAHTRTWNRATMEQKKQIAAVYEKTRDIEKAFSSVKFSKVMASDMEFAPARHGSQYSGR